MTAEDQLKAFGPPAEEAPEAESEQAQRPIGKIFTFYSFKGGVGRSMALANIAVLVAARGNRVLIIDFDLEAPGLEHFYTAHDGTLMQRLAKNPGVVDFLGPQPADWRKAATEIKLDRSTLATLAGRREVDQDRTRIDIIHSGKASRDANTYTEQVQRLNWAELYDRDKIGTHFGRLRAEWISDYDYVFVDSRTGVTDIGDLCTVVLPDHLVLQFITNQQNIDGIAAIYHRVVEEHGKLPIERSKLTVLPILSRDEFYSEYELSNRWRGKAAKELQALFADWLPKDLSPHEAFQKVFIPYFAIWSFGEALPVMDRPGELSNPASITAAYSRIARLIMNNLDWHVLDREADPSEIAQSREDQRAELEAEREKIQAEIAEQREVLERRAYDIESRRTELMKWIPGIVIGITVAVGAFQFISSTMDKESQIEKLLATNKELAATNADVNGKNDLLAEQLRITTASVYDLNELVTDCTDRADKFVESLVMNTDTSRLKESISIYQNEVADCKKALDDIRSLLKSRSSDLGKGTVFLAPLR